MRRATLTPVNIEKVAARFRALGEPARLQILQALRNGERCVSDLAEDTGLNQANLSRHLQLLTTMDLVTRRKEGLFVYYALAGTDVLRLCEIMCARVS